jgi:type II secretory pathway pseudopilin PulG
MARKKQNAFTLLETVIALGLLVMLCGAGFVGMQMASQGSSVARLYTLAQETARSQIDQIETASPFNPQRSQTPTILQVGTTTSTVPLYVDPSTNSTIVSGTMTTTIANLGSYNGISATVSVSYSFRTNHVYTVTMNTIRVSDNP